MSAGRRISLVVCARNEADNLRELLPKLATFGDDRLLIDGHSTDDTPGVARAHGLLVIPQRGHGKGLAIRQAIEEVQGDIVAFIDADQSHDPNDLPALVAPILEGRADLVIGSRILGGSDEYGDWRSHLVRYVVSRIVTFLIALRFRARITDSQNGLRAIRVDAARRMRLREHGFPIEQEMLMQALRLGLRIEEVPTHEYKRKYGHSHMSLSREFWGFLRSLILGLL